MLLLDMVCGWSLLTPGSSKSCNTVYSIDLVDGSSSHDDDDVRLHHSAPYETSDAGHGKTYIAPEELIGAMVTRTILLGSRVSGFNPGLRQQYIQQVLNRASTIKRPLPKLFYTSS